MHMLLCMYTAHSVSLKYVPTFWFKTHMACLVLSRVGFCFSSMFRSFVSLGKRSCGMSLAVVCTGWALMRLSSTGTTGASLATAGGSLLDGATRVFGSDTKQHSKPIVSYRFYQASMMVHPTDGAAWSNVHACSTV